jgi:dTDP-glucose pyrophosphorylase
VKYQGAILAGGTGTRIRPLSLTIPKPMLPVLNAPLIERQLKSMETAGIEKVFVVVGSLDGMIADYLKSRRGADIELVEQSSPQGIAHAASLLEGKIRAPFFLFLADIFYTGLDLGAMMSLKEKAGCDGVVAVNREPNAGYIRRNFTVYLDGDSRITAVRDKPEKVDTDLKGCGIYLFGEGLFEAIRRTPKNGKRGELELTSSIQVMIDSGASILAGEGVRGDVNITDPVDLLVSNLRALVSEG